MKNEHRGGGSDDRIYKLNRERVATNYFVNRSHHIKHAPPAASDPCELNYQVLINCAASMPHLIQRKPKEVVRVGITAKESL